MRGEKDGQRRQRKEGGERDEDEQKGKRVKEREISKMERGKRKDEKSK